MKNLLVLLIFVFATGPVLATVNGTAVAAEQLTMVSESAHHQQMGDHDCCDAELESLPANTASSGHNCEGQCGDCQQQCHSASSLLLSWHALLIPALNAVTIGYLPQPYQTDLEPTQKPPMPA